LFDSCIIHILYTGCAKFKKHNSGAKGLTVILDKTKRWTSWPDSAKPGQELRYLCSTMLVDNQRWSGRFRQEKSL